MVCTDSLRTLCSLVCRVSMTLDWAGHYAWAFGGRCFVWENVFQVDRRHAKATLKLRQALCFAVAKSVLYSGSKHTLESARARPSAGTTCSGMGSVHINSMIVDSRSHADVLFSEET